jgi:hypothetical protein
VKAKGQSNQHSGVLPNLSHLFCLDTAYSSYQNVQFDYCLHTIVERIPIAFAVPLICSVFLEKRWRAQPQQLNHNDCFDSPFLERMFYICMQSFD